jgi:hypothetical protein
MPARLHVAIAVLLTLVISVTSAAASAPGRVRVRSTLDGKTVLPHRVRWVAHPSPRSRVKSVKFLIDGKLRWVEHNSPFVYGDDTDWLVTSWLRPGKHAFTVRATTRDGRTVSRTTKARVLPTPAPPAELAGTRWTHLLKNQGENGSPAGTWSLRVTPTGWKIEDPNASTNFIDVAYLSPGVVELRGGIWTRPRSLQEGNGWCEDTNQAVRYHWAVAGDQLTLSLAGPKRCGDQATVLAGAGVPRSSGGTWTRVP